MNRRRAVNTTQVLAAAVLALGGLAQAASPIAVVPPAELTPHARACAGVASAALTAAEIDAVLRIKPGRALAAACAADTTDVLAQVRIGQALLGLGRSDDAAAMLEALRSDAERPDALPWRSAWRLLAADLARDRADLTAAEPLYAHARQAFESIGPAPSRDYVEALVGQGAVWRRRAQLDRAAQNAELAQRTLDAMGLALSYEATDVLNLRTVIAFSSNDLPEAVRMARAEIDTTRAIGLGDDPALLHAYASLGGTLSTLGRMSEALAAFDEGLALMARHPEAEPYGQLGLLQNLSATYQTLGRFDEALQQSERALAIATVRYGEASVQRVRPLMRRAATLRHMARYGAADRAYADVAALAARQRKNLPADQWFEVRNGQAAVAIALGDLPTARAALEQALRDVGSDRYWRGRLLTELAELDAQQGATAVAADRLGEATGLVASVVGAGNPFAVGLQAAQCRMQLRAGQGASACAGLNDALPGLAVANAMVRWRALDALAAQAQARGDAQAAGPLWLAALATADAAGTADPRWRALDAMAQFQRAQGRRSLAVYFGKQSLVAIEALRGEVRINAAAAEHSFLADKLAVYRRVADWLAEDQRVDEALAVLRLLKIEEFRDFVQRDGALAGAGRELPLDGAERRLAAGFAALSALRTPAGAAADDPAWQQRAKALLDAFAGAASTTAAATATRRAAPAVVGAAPVPPGELHVWAIAGDEALTLVFDAPGGKRQVLRQPWPRGQIGRDVGAALSVWSAPALPALGTDAATRDRLAALYRRLGAPIDTAARAAGAHRVRLRLDGALRYVPLAALSDGRGFLGERYAFDSIAANARGDASAALGDRLALHALGVSNATGGRPALPGVAAEVCAIVDGPLHGLAAADCAAPRRGALPGEAWLNEAFTVTQLSLALAPAAGPDGVSMLHLGTHFDLRPGNMDRSTLLLGDGTRLTLGELAQLPFGAQTLVTLSACETGLGGGRGDDGREIDGLGGVILRRGAGAVLASLWRVDDASTGRLMRAFYTALRRAPPAEALRLAQQAVRQTDGGAWASPFHWAGFYLSTRAP